MDIRKAIIAAQGDHAIFAPSSSAGWLYCEDYIFANHDKPDNANEDAAYGTVGHGVGEEWLNAVKARTGNTPLKSHPLAELIGECYPSHLIGTTRIVKGADREFEIEIDEDMVSYVLEYVEWCAELPGDHFIETRVDFSDLTPIPGQGGTADHAACQPGRLVITDLKMGKGVKVFAEWNTQGLLYAYGFFKEWDWAYDFEEIVIRICQPRIEHFDEWTITRAELLAFGEWVKGRAVKAWTPGGPRSPGPKQCQWCKDVECAARLALLHQETDECFDDLTEGEVIEGQFSVVTETAMVAAKSALDGGWRPDPRSPATLSTVQLERLLKIRKMTEKWFAEIEAELESRATNGEDLEFWKLVPGRAGRRAWAGREEAEALALKLGIDPLLLYKIETLSPAQFEEVVRREAGVTKKKAGELLSSAVIRPPSRMTLAPLSDEREELASPGDVFDDLTEDDL